MEKKSSANQENVIFPIILFFGIFAVLLFAFAPRDTRIEPRPTQVAVVQATQQPVAQPTPRDHLELMASGLETVLASDVRAGGRLYGSVCSACHGVNLQGISGLGKPLINSDFVNRLNDDELVAFIAVGRTTRDPLNTTGVAMPAKGGNPSLTDQNLHQIVDYIRSFNGATVVNDLPEQTPIVYEQREFVPFDLSAINVPSQRNTQSETNQTPAPATDMTETSQAPVVIAVITPAPQGSPEQLYAWYCSQCHGLGGEGNPTMPNSALVGMTIDKNGLFTMFTQPTELTYLFTHAYRGGYPELRDDQLNSLLDYVVTLSVSSQESTQPIIDISIPSQQIDTTQAREDYGWYCSQCHGANGEGNPTMPNSALVGITINEEAFFTLLTTPPAFGTVVVHPYRGGYPELSDERIRNLIIYVNRLSGE
ncbi:MAG: hypothetical protein CUN52_11900 [Phototrophicales bacterium]|nr:MAG: hypothetical protein CUN52_11900 [Phototrophicales bacterium]